MKFLSRKFFVFVIATVLLIFDKITDTVWLTLALVYLGLQAYLDKVQSK